MELPFELSEKELAAFKAYHHRSLVDVVSDQIVYIKLIARRKKFKKFQLIIYINDMPLVLLGSKIYEDENFDYILFKFFSDHLPESFMYYFELTADGVLEYLGINGIYPEEWKVEAFEFRSSDFSIDFNDFENLMTKAVFLMEDDADLDSLFPVMKKIGLGEVVSECKVNANNNSEFPVTPIDKFYNNISLKNELGVLSRNFEESCKKFFIERKITAREFVSQLSNPVFVHHIMLTFVKLNAIEIPHNGEFTDDVLKSYKLSVALQFTFPGIPAIPLKNLKKCGEEMIEFYKRIVEIKNTHPALKNGEFRFVFSNNDVLGFERKINEHEKLLMFFNRSDENFVMDVTSYLGNGDFVDVSKEHPLKRKRLFSLCSKDFVILKKVRER